MRVPVSTYRLQVTEEFDLFEVARRLPYLHDLGADWVYLSPLLAAETRSTHGYDVVAHDQIDPSRGGAAGPGRGGRRGAPARDGRARSTSCPTTSASPRRATTPWWWDLLEHGRESAYAEAFDIDWDAGAGRIRIPVVGDDDDGLDQRSRTARCATTSTASRWRPAPPRVEEQHYELVHWKVADDGLNYRRFFAVNTLAGVRVEDPRRARATPTSRSGAGSTRASSTGCGWTTPTACATRAATSTTSPTLTGGAYVLVEKILEPGERLPTSWATAGTTGYGALGLVDRVLTDSQGQARSTPSRPGSAAPRSTGTQLIHDTKRAVADGILRSEVNRVTRELVAAGVHVDHGTIADAVAELAACFPVYRSYLPEGREHLDQAFAPARQPPTRPGAGARRARRRPSPTPSHPPAQRFQQTTGAVMAKGVEDCAFYRVLAAHLAQRGRRRPERVLARVVPTSTR